MSARCDDGTSDGTCMVKLGNQIQLPYQWETLMLVKHHPNIPTLQTCIKKHKKVKMSTFVKRVIKISGDMIVLNICTLLSGIVRKLRVVCLQVSLDHYDNNKTKSRWGSFIAPLVWGGAILQNSPKIAVSLHLSHSSILNQYPGAIWQILKEL